MTALIIVSRCVCCNFLIALKESSIHVDGRRVVLQREILLTASHGKLY